MTFSYEWSERYVTGIDVVDSQHQRLFQYLRDVDQALKGDDSEAIEGVVRGLLDYAVSHCLFEEGLMERAHYALLEPHRHAHDLFRQRAERYLRQLKQGEDHRAIAREVRSAIALWLTGHILHDDMDYVKDVKRMLEHDRSFVLRMIDRIFHHPGTKAAAEPDPAAGQN